MSFGRAPIEPKEREAPIVALERWREHDGALHKTYRFRGPDMRDDFVTALLAYERNTQHQARIVLDEGTVVLRVQTRDAERVTELDKEYAAYADVLYRDVVTRPAAVSSADDLV